MPYTIATHVGTKIARQHNIRDKRITDKEAHIDPNGKHEVWFNCNLTEKEAYHKLFDSAVAEYNSRQKRNDRKISDKNGTTAEYPITMKKSKMTSRSIPLMK